MQNVTRQSIFPQYCHSNRLKFKALLMLLSLLPVLCLLPLSSANAFGHYHEFINKPLPHMFTQFESNALDTIEGVGIGYLFESNVNSLGLQLNTSFNNAKITTTNGTQENYISWEGSARYGLFSPVMLYLEAGVDLGELFFEHRHYKHHDYYHHSDSNDVDAFIGVGAGFKLKSLSVSGYIRSREIDGYGWQAKSNTYSGISFSIHF